jgi:hypothetical protein
MPTINSLLNILNSTPWLNFALLVLAVVAIVLAIIFYFLSRRLRKPTYAIRNVNLIMDKVKRIESVELLFQKRHVDNLSIARVAIWNRGRETISRENVAIQDPLRIEAMGDVEILEAKIIYEKQKANRFAINMDPSQKKLTIDFDYFDRDEGIILQIFHTGKRKDELSVLGTTKGSGGMQKISDPWFLKFDSELNVFAAMKTRYKKIIFGSALIITSILFLFSPYIPQPQFGKNKFSIEYLTLVFFALAYFFMGLSILRKRVPAGFELFEDDIEP